MDASLAQCAAQSVAQFGSMVTLLMQTISDANCNISPPSMWPPDYGPTAVANGSLGPYDFIVIGGGAAGSVVASRLSENPNCTVLLLESGNLPPTETQVPGTYQSLEGTTIDWNFRIENTEHVCRGMRYGTCILSSGKVLGGSSSINNMLYQRGRPHDYDHWEELGADNWNFDACLPYFLKSEDNKDFVNRCHNQSGPIPVTFFPTTLSTIRDTITTAFQQRGMQSITDFNDCDQSQLGYGTSQATIDGTRRVNPASAFLSAAQNRTNLQVVYMVQVNNITIEDDIVTSLNILYNNTNNFTVVCNKEVILSTGAINTPQILMLSGIGPKKHLESFGIPVSKDAKVGENLQDQFVVPLCFQHGSANPVTGLDQLDNIYNYLIHNTGPFASTGLSDLLQYRKKNDSLGVPDCVVTHVYYPAGSTSLASDFQAMGYKQNITQPIIDSNQVADTCCFQVALLRPKSRGKIELRSSDPADTPLISPNYLNEPDDVKILTRECKYQAGIVNTAAFRSVSVQLIQLPICTDLENGSDKYWECYIRQMGTTYNNPVGTAKMGSSKDKTAVLDSRCKVRGVEGLRVCDSSVMPVSVSTNSNAPTVMVAERVSDFIKQDWKLRN